MAHVQQTGSHPRPRAQAWVAAAAAAMLKVEPQLGYWITVLSLLAAGGLAVAPPWTPRSSPM